MTEREAFFLLRRHSRWVTLCPSRRFPDNKLRGQVLAGILKKGPFSTFPNILTEEGLDETTGVTFGRLSNVPETCYVLTERRRNHRMDAIRTVSNGLIGVISQEGLIAITVISALMFVGTILLIPVIVVRLPVDYFFHNDERVWLAGYHPVLRHVGVVVKNGIGLVFLLAGLAMLVLPGQGLLTMVIGISLLDFPGKQKIERRLLTQPMILQAMNAIRRKFDKPPFVRPPASMGTP